MASHLNLDAQTLKAADECLVVRQLSKQPMKPSVRCFEGRDLPGLKLLMTLSHKSTKLGDFLRPEARCSQTDSERFQLHPDHINVVNLLESKCCDKDALMRTVLNYAFSNQPSYRFSQWGAAHPHAFGETTLVQALSGGEFALSNQTCDMIIDLLIDQVCLHRNVH